MHVRRAGAFVAVLACAALATTQVRAEDPPKAASPRPPVLELQADKEYRFSYTETVRMTSQQESTRGEDSGNVQKAELNWQVTVKLAEKQPGSGPVVTLAVTSAKGWYESKTSPRSDFDRSKVFAEPMRVTLSPNGQVLKVEGRPADKVAEKISDEDDASRARRALVERLFQTLPPTPVRAGTKWDAKRLAAPDMVWTDQHVLGEYSEEASVKKAGADGFTAALSAKGKNKVKRRRIDENPKRRRSVYQELEEWSVSGECEVASDTGLARSRTTHCEMKSYLDVWSGDLSVISSSTYEYDTRLEAVGPK